MSPMFKTRISNLLTVKSIVTFSLTSAFVYLSIIGKVPVEQYMTIYTVIIGFYFGTQVDKNK
jgi:hypothetical protein